MLGVIYPDRQVDATVIALFCLVACTHSAHYDRLLLLAEKLSTASKIFVDDRLNSLGEPPVISELFKYLI
jgi:hypothetical protein